MTSSSGFDVDSAPRESTGDLPAHVTAPLLSLVADQAMDSDYETAAIRRTEAGAPVMINWLPVACVIGLVGALVTIAVLQTSRNSAVDETNRASLIAQVTEARQQVDDLQDDLTGLRDETYGYDTRLASLTQSLRSAEQKELRLQARTGYAPVHGPGVTAKVDDAASGDALQVVQDDDLVLLIDGLWAAGAEAISINGERLTALSSIQNSGRAIHVNDVPLRPPYIVLAIGDPGQLQSRLVDTSQGARWFQLVQTYAFRFEMTNSRDLSLPSAPPVRLRYAKPLNSDPIASN